MDASPTTKIAAPGLSPARMLQKATALLVVLSFNLLLPAGDAAARPGGGQTFKSSSTGSKSSGSTSKPSSGSTYKPSSNTNTSSGTSTKSNTSSNTSSGTSTGYSSGTTSGYSSGTTSGGYSDHGSEPKGGHALLFFAVVFLVAGLVFYLYFKREIDEKLDWSTEPPGIEPPRVNDEQKLSVAGSFRKLLGLDPTFSRVLLEDFLYALYAETQQARGGGRLGRLAAYLSAQAQGAYSGQPTEVRDVVVGSLAFEGVSVPGDRNGRASLTVRFIANYTEVGPAGEQAYYAEEVWRLSRSLAIPSRKPENARTIGCPSCGGPLDKVLQGTCSYCKARLTGEQELDWRVDSISVESREQRGPMLTGSTTDEEQGTDFPTVFDPSLNRTQTELQGRDPEFQWPAFEARVAAIFSVFHEAWSSQNLAPMRPFLSDNLFEIQNYWVEAYKKQGLRNVSDSPRLLRQEVCKVETDGHYDLITVRLHAQNIDYTVDKGGQVVSGNKSKTRSYTEYWTLIRGKEAHGAPRADRACPSCGAPNDQINMAGKCGSCGVKVTSGTFDWVLSRIEQDDVYTG